ncbi:YdeI/OmpD-associated family protein [Paenibacillus sp. KQZ6P-2]|uniref:YdeI/OmpD-associated family protein n=1 Tax=Paenibacillus mangrovi TaxID=2931978 RepID=A0A9X1WR64_9BACL|nr:YdeI/OmpD-associated family protein [Paenibacillus mangrovi]MCJ8013569.1 YdeI/OmpD-associated family protein [Paenibacillus mangrovi]
MNEFKINYVPQPDFSSCDEACLAMIAQITIEEAMAAMRGKKGSGTSDFYKALKRYKIDYLSWRDIDTIDELPPLCVLLVKFPTYTHSVLYCDGTFYDPEYGVFESKYEPNGEITHFMELYIDEIYKNKEINVKIPQDFKEAFEKDEVANNLFQNLSYPEKSKFIYGISHFKNPKTRRKNIEKRMTELKK